MYFCKPKQTIMAQDLNFKFFTDNHDKLYKDYPNTFVVIQDQKVLYSAKTFEEALKEAINRKLDLGTFLIQECTEGKDAYTQTFHSRVIFA